MNFIGNINLGQTSCLNLDKFGIGNNIPQTWQLDKDRSKINKDQIGSTNPIQSNSKIKVDWYKNQVSFDFYWFLSISIVVLY